MIKTLLENKGRLETDLIAKAILSHDISQIEYYQNITNNMVGRILRNHKIVQKVKDEYELIGYSELSDEEINEIISECDKKIDEYKKKRGKDIWQHRRKTRKTVPGSIRYRVLKRANFRCELCGISADEKALEVDHIVPKNIGGEDSINNYQALCYTCNAQKRDTDDTDFRSISELYNERIESCIFCSLNDREIQEENNLALSFFDKYPVSKYHTIIVPKRHVSDYFNLFQAEINAVDQIIRTTKDKIQKKDPSITGYNIGINNGIDAGQTIGHCHVHLIPRRKNDVSDPTGGVRLVFPDKGNYKNNAP